MNKRGLFIALMGVMLLAACDATLGELVGTLDWCKVYDFRNDDYGVIFDDEGYGPNGQWVPGGGLLNDQYGQLRFSLTESFTVYPKAVAFQFIRGLNPGIIHLHNADGQVFGVELPDIPGFFSPQIAADQNELFVYRTVKNFESPSGNTIELEAETSTHEFYLASLVVWGDGVSPYGTTDCAPGLGSTNTPVDAPTQTPQPTDTPEPSPTITQTPTETFTPTITPTLPGCKTIRAYDDSETEFYDYPGSYNTGATPVENSGDTFYRYDGAQLPQLFHFNDPYPGLNWYVTGFAIRAGRQSGSNSVLRVQLFQGANVMATGSNVNLDNAPYNVGNGGRVVSNSVTPNTVYNVDGFLVDRLSGSISWIGYISITVCPEGHQTPTPTPTYTPTNTFTPNVPNTATNTATPSNTNTARPSATRTPSNTPLPPVASPTAQTPVPSWTTAPSLPPPSPPPTLTLIPQPTAAGSSTALATYPVPVLTGLPGVTVEATIEVLATIDEVGGHSYIYDLLSTAVVEVNNLPENLEGYIPSPNVSPLMGYAKWFLSCTSIEEILGVNVGTIACHTVVGVSLLIIVSGVVVTVRIITLLVKFAVWIFGKILGLIPGMGG